MLLLVVGGSTARAAEPSFDVGLGFGFADAASSQGFDGGWDLQLGCEWNPRAKWRHGAQLHVIRGWTSRGDITGETEMAFDSMAANFTFRPRKRAARWIQFKTGLVYARYKTALFDDDGIGVAGGIGIVLGSENKVRLHLLDYSRYHIDGRSFNTYSLSFALFFH